MKELNNKDFYIFGTGSTARFVKKILELDNKNVVAFLASNQDLWEIEKIPVIDISENDLLVEKSIPIIIGVFNRNKNASMLFIHRFLTDRNFNNIITLYEFYDKFPKNLKNLYWLTHRSFYQMNLPQFLKTAKLFSEKRSIQNFHGVINFLKTFDFKYLPEPEFDNQYFPDDIPIWDGKNTFIDIGSYDGSNIIDAFSKFGKLSTVIAYEPDPENIRKIKVNLKKVNAADNTYLIPCGVWSKTEILSFSSKEGEGSSIHTEGDMMVQCLSLDDTLIGVVPGYIKMDIEGAEFDALKGAELLIRKYKPSLAVCLYHNPNHFFEIPLLIHSWNLGYEFYIRLHGNNLFETVLYCVNIGDVNV